MFIDNRMQSLSGQTQESIGLDPEIFYNLHNFINTINPIVEKMEVKPKVNLQWWFNKKYQERFN